MTIYGKGAIVHGAGGGGGVICILHEYCKHRNVVLFRSGRLVYGQNTRSEAFFVWEEGVGAVVDPTFYRFI